VKQKLRTAAKLVAVLLLVTVALHPLFRSTLPWSADGQLHFWRIVELDHCLRNGYFYPRWMPDMAQGYGFPLLNYYAPLSIYLAQGFHLLGLGFTTALLAAFSASLALGALGAFFWAREAFGEAGGIVAAVAYTYAPYTLYDAIWRGNLAESLALGVLPWAFWRLRRLALDGDSRNMAPAALAFALLVLSHNVTALIASPLLAGYALLLWLTSKCPPKTLGRLAGALALGLALSAFFWLPAFFERAFVQTEKMITTSHFDYRHNFLEPGELLSPPVTADVTLMNPPVPRSLGWPTLLLAALGAAGNWMAGKWAGWKARSVPPSPPSSSLRWETLATLLCLLLCAFLTLSTSRILWEKVPLLPYVGFPWRFLGPAGLMAAWLAGAAARWAERWAPGVGLAVLAIVVFSLTWLYPRHMEAMNNLTPAGLIAFEKKSGALGTTSVGEYLPIWVKELPQPKGLEAQYQAGGAIQRLATESLPEGATIISETWQLVGGDVTVNSPHDWTATLQLFYFPGWRVWLNGVEARTTPTSPHGLIQFAVPAGETHVKVRFGPMPWRLAGTALSSAGLLSLAALFARRLSSHRGGASRAIMPGIPSNRPVWAGALVTVGLILGVKVAYLDTHDSPVRVTGFNGQEAAGTSAPVQVSFADGIRLLGYDPATLVVEAAGSLPLDLYWTADTPPGEEYSSFLHLVDAEGHRWGQSDNQHPGGYPTVRWRPGEYNRDAHTLKVLPGTPPGNYILRAGLLVPASGVGLDVLDERGAPAGTSVAIGTVAVTRSPQPPPVEALPMAHRLDAHLGDLTLLGLSLDRPEAAPGDTLHLTFYWRADQKVQDYTLSLQMLDQKGRAVTETPLPLATTAYPPGQWTAGEIVQGQHWLTLPASLDSGTYAMQLQLLDGDKRSVGAPLPLGEAGQITVVAPARQVTVPPMQHRLDANLGDQVTLLGYDLEPEIARPGETLRLTLYWRAEQPMRRSYTVFAHLLDANSRFVVQDDSVPAGWTRPTTGWLPGEIIVDLHPLSLAGDVPAGDYFLQVGLYDAENNDRLPVLDTAGQIVQDRVQLDPITVER